LTRLFALEYYEQQNHASMIAVTVVEVEASDSLMIILSSSTPNRGASTSMLAIILLISQAYCV
jgi:hypothetical protein